MREGPGLTGFTFRDSGFRQDDGKLTTRNRTLPEPPGALTNDRVAATVKGEPPVAQVAGQRGRRKAAFPLPA